MNLRDLIRIHHATTRPEGHPEVFGDGYLLRHNFIYRNFRVFAAKAGYRSVEAWPDYMRGALFQLDRILEDKQIPFMYNTRLYEAIDARQPGKFDVDELPGPPRNHAFHESAHAIADTLLPKAPARNVQLRLLRSVMGECLANTCEAMSWALAITESHRDFLRLNSYFAESVHTQQLRGRVIALLGFQSAFQLIYYSYLYSNFLYESISPAAVAGLVRQLSPKQKLNARQMSQCVNLFNCALDLSLEFRTRTTAYYLKSQGYEENVFKLFDFDFRKVLAAKPSWRAPIAEFARIAEFGQSEPRKVKQRARRQARTPNIKDLGL